jgi:hypothetical protein
MVREPDATMQPAPQDNQLMSKHRVLSFKPQLRLEWRGQDGQSETEQPDHSASLGDSITSSTRIRFSVHTASIGSAIRGATSSVVLKQRAGDDARFTQIRRYHRDERIAKSVYRWLKAKGRPEKQ